MDKTFLRAEYLNKRKGLKQNEIAEKNTAIIKNFKGFLSEKAIGAIHLFLTQQAKVEIDTWPIISFLQKDYPNIAIAVPRIIPGTREMEHFLLTPHTNLIENRWKIPEPDPITGVKTEPKKIDAVLIPLLAFDKKGFRVGYGGGYYDRFLAQCRPDIIKIGLSFFEPVSEIDDIDPFDIGMDYCITPSGVVRF